MIAYSKNIHDLEKKIGKSKNVREFEQNVLEFKNYSQN